MLYSICAWFNYLVTISPTEECEMGFDENDKPYPGGGVKVHGLSFTKYSMLFGFLLLNSYKNLYNWAELTSIEIILILVLISATALRLECYNELDYFFTFGLGIREGHELITTGPYKYLIHPSYTGQLTVHYCFWALMLLIDGNVVSYMIFVILVGYSLYVCKYRVKMEEKMMEEEFGEEYIEYKEARYRFIPFVC